MNRFTCGWWILPSCILGVVLWFGIIGLVMADTMPVSWTPPTERSDGSALTPPEIANYRVFDNDVALPDLVPGDATSVTLTLPPGDHRIYLTTIDTFGRESVPSEEKFVPGGAPNPPSQILIIVLP